MLAANVNELELAKVRSAADPTVGCRVGWPVYAATGAAACGVVYFEVAPGGCLGRHIDSAEEVIIVVAGVASVTVGDETATAREGAIALVPAGVPHEVRNAGEAPLRFWAVYAATHVTTTYDEPVRPDGGRERNPLG